MGRTMGENVRETKELDIIIQIQNAVSRLLMNVGYAERVYDGQYKQFLRWKNSLPDTELIDALELITEHETNLSKERKRIDLEKNAVAEVIEIFGESVLNYSLIEIQNILKQDNLSFSGKRLSPVWVALLNGLDSLGKPDLTPTLIKEVQSYADDGLVHPEYREVKRHFALIRAREIITGCRELNNQPQISKAEDRQGAEPAEGAPIRKPDIGQLVRDHKKGDDWDDLVFGEIDSMIGTTQKKKVEQFCSFYSAPGSILSSYKSYQSRDFSGGKRRPRRTSKKKV
jgi:hypothetical protein